jgi:hypothetical protein
MDGIFDPASVGVSDTPQYQFSIGPQSDGTYNIPSTGVAISNGADQGGNGASYAPQIFSLLNNGLGAFTSIYNNNAMLDYRRYEATQAGLVAQGQATGQIASAQIGAVQSNKMLMILGIFAVIALAIHKG